MATVNGVNQTKILAGGSGDYVVGRGEFGGTEKVVYDTYEATNVASGATIGIATPPAGSIIVGCTIAFDDLGAGCTISLGDAGSATRYTAALDAATAASVSSAIKVDGMGYVIGTATTDSPMLLTVAGSKITGTIKVVIKYV